jgi:hypothetical protein
VRAADVALVRGKFGDVAIIVGLLVGVGFVLEGVSLFLRGTGQPGVGPILTATGVYGGNLSLIEGLLLIVAGVATLSGTVSYGLQRWNGVSDDNED